jgi:hypothetical protein
LEAMRGRGAVVFDGAEAQRLSISHSLCTRRIRPRSARWSRRRALDSSQ